MNPERWRRIEEIFQTVADRPTAERDAYLTRACGDDEDLRKEVVSLLSHESPETFILDPIKSAAVSLISAPEGEKADERIGAFRITRLVGRGGMGAVYEAMRDDAQFEQRVAIKIIKRGTDTDFARDRFRRERHILAGLEHPHIARLLDGGSTEDGLPYFVMEFVEGESITSYCRRHKLSLIARLKLFRRVCSAVQYAHQKLVVHRDIKPGNILVTEDGTPKLLDFGIAKLLAHEPGEAITQTETALRMMTPDYASPEQVRGLAITTATDVYSLGAVLYELLTGCRPHQFNTHSLLEIERVICDTETEEPSRAVKRLMDAPAGLARRLAGDLDKIVMMSLRKEPERRYQSVEQFSEDIRRHLEGRPVIARKDTVSYRASKFIQRHKLGMAATLLVILSLIGGIVATSWQARRAERRFEQVRHLANTFLFDVHDKIQSLPGSTEARELVVKTALEYLDSLAQEAEGDAELEWELAVAYQKIGDVQGNPWDANLGHTEAAIKSYQKSLALAERLIARDSSNPDRRRTLAQNYFKMGALLSEAGNKMGAQKMLRQSAALTQSLVKEMNEEDDIVLLINIYTRIGDTELDTGDVASSIDTYSQTLQLSDMRAAEYPGDNAQLNVAFSHSHVGEALAATGDLEGAIRSYRVSLAIIEELAEKQPLNLRFSRGVMIAHFWLGNLSGGLHFINMGDRAAALDHHQKALVIAEAAAATDAKNAAHRLDLVTSYQNVAEALSEDDPAHAAEFYRRALALVRSQLEIEPNDFRFLRREALCLSGLAAPLERMGDRQNARENLNQALDILKRLAAQDEANVRIQADLYMTLQALGDFDLRTGNLSLAEEYYLQALALTELESANNSSVYAMWRLADAYSGLGRYWAAKAVGERAKTDERISCWQRARAWREKSLKVWNEWPTHAVSSVFDITRREQAARALAECDSALAKLNASSGR